jgi:hypothetical protein
MCFIMFICAFNIFWSYLPPSYLLLPPSPSCCFLFSSLPPFYFHNIIFNFLTFWIILFLNYHTLIIWGDFIVIIPYMYTGYFEQAHPLRYIFIPSLLLSPLSNRVWCALLHCLHMYICNVFPSPSPLSVLFFPHPLLLIPPNTPPYNSYPIIINNHHHSRSRFHNWVGTCNIWLFEFSK